MDEEREPWEVAVLIHAFAWKASRAELELGPGLTLGRLDASQVGDLYEELCETRLLDNGSPLGFEVFARIDPRRCKQFIPCGDAYGTAERVCDLLAVHYSRPVVVCRYIESNDRFATARGSELVIHYSQAAEDLQWNHATPLFPKTDYPAIRDEDVAALQALWKGIDEAGWRVHEALLQFHYAWRAPYLDQTCLSLAIALELLFAPQTATEVSHQIAFNVARFLGEDRQDRERLYRQVKKFYSVRSTLVHGGLAKDADVNGHTPPAFDLVARILRKILSDSELNRTFQEEALRRQILDNYLFA